MHPLCQNKRCYFVFELCLLLEILYSLTLEYVKAQYQCSSEFNPKYTWAGIAQSVQRLATGWTARDQILVDARSSAPVQTGSGAHPASCTMGTGFLSLG